MLAAQRSVLLRFENIDSVLHAAKTARMLLPGSIRRNAKNKSSCEDENQAGAFGEFPRELAQRFPPLTASNDILERFIPSCVVSAKCACYIQVRHRSVNGETVIR